MSNLDDHLLNVAELPGGRAYPKLGSGEQNPTRMAFLDAVMDMYSTGNPIQTATLPVPSILIHDTRIVSLGGGITEISGQSGRFKVLVQSGEFQDLLLRIGVSLGWPEDHEVRIVLEPNPNFPQIQALTAKLLDLHARCRKGEAWLEENWDYQNHRPKTLTTAAYEAGVSRYREVLDSYMEAYGQIESLGGRVDEIRLFGKRFKYPSLLPSQIEAARRFMELSQHQVQGAEEIELRTPWGLVRITQERSKFRTPGVAEITWSELHANPIEALHAAQTVLFTRHAFSGNISDTDPEWNARLEESAKEQKNRYQKALESSMAKHGVNPEGVIDLTGSDKSEAVIDLTGGSNFVKGRGYV